MWILSYVDFVRGDIVRGDFDQGEFDLGDFDLGDFVLSPRGSVQIVIKKKRLYGIYTC